MAKKFDELKITKNIGMIKHKLIVLSDKCGVGKTTDSTSPALVLSERGYDDGLVDSNPSWSSIPKMLSIEDKKPEASEVGMNPVFFSSKLKVISMAFLLQDVDSSVIWHEPLKMMAIKQLIGDD